MKFVPVNRKSLKLPNALAKKESSEKFKYSLKTQISAHSLSPLILLNPRKTFLHKNFLYLPEKINFSSSKKKIFTGKAISKQQIPWYFTLISSRPSLFTASCWLTESCKISLWYLWVKAWQCQKGFTFIRWLTTWWNQK